MRINPYFLPISVIVEWLFSNNLASLPTTICKGNWYNENLLQLPTLRLAAIEKKK